MWQPPTPADYSKTDLPFSRCYSPFPRPSIFDSTAIVQSFIGGDRLYVSSLEFYELTYFTTIPISRRELYFDHLELSYLDSP